MRLEEHVDRIRRKGTFTEFWLESQKLRHHYEKLDLGES
jgi:hypothetical protein